MRDLGYRVAQAQKKAMKVLSVVVIKHLPKEHGIHRSKKGSEKKFSRLPDAYKDFCATLQVSGRECDDPDLLIKQP